MRNYGNGYCIGNNKCECDIFGVRISGPCMCQSLRALQITVGLTHSAIQLIPTFKTTAIIHTMSHVHSVASYKKF